MANFTNMHLGSGLLNLLKVPYRGFKGFSGFGNPSDLPGAIGNAASTAASTVGNAASTVASKIGSGIKTTFGDTPSEVHQVETYNPQQQEVLDLLLQLGGEKQLNPQAGFEPIAQNAYNDFFQNIVPGLKETFAGIGSSSSPALHTALSGAGASLAQRLAAMQSEYGMQNQFSGLQQLQLGLNPRSENYFQQSEPGLARNFANKIPELAAAYYGLNQQNQTARLLDQLKNR